MSIPKGKQQLPLERRMEIFQAMVNARGQGLSTVDARKLATLRFKVTEADVIGIEEEGLQGDWPPL